MRENYYKGDGKVFFAPIDKDNKRVGPFKWVGNVEELSMSINEESIEKVESYTGRNQVVRKIPTKTTLSINCTMNQFDPENLALCVNGVAVQKIGSSKEQEEILGAVKNLVIDGLYPLKAKNLSNVVVKCGTTTLTLGHNYALNAKAGSITILNLTTDENSKALTLSGNVVVTYTAGDYEFTSIMTNTNKRVALRFEGLNSAETDEQGNPQGVLVEFYLVQVSPTSQLGFIQKEFASFPITGEALLDTNRPADDEFGQFGYVAVI